MQIELKKNNLITQVKQLMKVYELGKNGHKFTKKEACEVIAFSYGQAYWNEINAMLMSEMIEKT